MSVTDDLFDRPATDPLDNGRMTIWEHIDELRSRLIRCIAGIVVGMAVGFIAYRPILDFLIAPYRKINPDAQLYVTSLTEGFGIRVQTSMYVGIALAMPIILWQLWRFVTPGLYPHEKRYAVPFVGTALFLFVAGATLAYFSLPATIEFLLEFKTDLVKELPSVDSYLKLNLFMMMAFGAGFEFPVLLVALQLVGVLTWRQLLKWWRYAMVVISVVAAVITPAGDPVSMLMLAVPMFFLYFLAVLVGFVLTRNRAAGAARSDA